MKNTFDLLFIYYDPTKLKKTLFLLFAHLVENGGKCLRVDESDVSPFGR